MKKLTPYDTGNRLEPRVWVPAVDDDFGRVDFEDDAGITILPGLYIERTATGPEMGDGRYVLHYDSNGNDVTVVDASAPAWGTEQAAALDRHARGEHRTKPYTVGELARIFAVMAAENPEYLVGVETEEEEMFFITDFDWTAATSLGTNMVVSFSLTER